MHLGGRVLTTDGITDTGSGGSATVFNESGSTADFRIESDSNTHMFFLDGGTNKIGLNNSSPSVLLDVSGNTRIVANDTGNHSFQVNRASDGSQSFRINQSGEVVVSNNYLYCTGAGQSLYVQNGAVFRGNITNDGGDVTINDNLQVNGNISSNALNYPFDA